MAEDPNSPAHAAQTAQASEGPVLEVDEDEFYDSAVEAPSEASTTASITSSVLKFRVENGRSYHAYKDGSYHFPNDEQENDRLDLQHHMTLLTLGNKLHLAPIRNVRRALDVATGTGLWAIDFADENPQTQVIGNDLSPIQPPFVPPNASFEIDDAEEPWTYSQKFDFIHSGFLCGSFKDYPRYFRQAFEFLNPGGWVEAFDVTQPMKCDDDTMPPDSPLARWSNLWAEAAVKSGSCLDAAERYKQYMEDAGFINVQEVRFKWANNPWPKAKKDKHLGQWNCENMLQGIEGFTLAFFTRWLGWGVDECQVLLAQVRDDLRNRKMHSYADVYCVYGQKPPTT